MTRFGEIAPLWQIFKNLCKYIDALFGFGERFQLTLARFVCYGQIFIAENDQILKTQLGHLVTLILGHKLFGQDRTGPERYIASNETFLCQKNNIERFTDSRFLFQRKAFKT